MDIEKGSPLRASFEILCVSSLGFRLGNIFFQFSLFPGSVFQFLAQLSLQPDYSSCRFLLLVSLEASIPHGLVLHEKLRTYRLSPTVPFFLTDRSGYYRIHRNSPHPFQDVSSRSYTLPLSHSPLPATRSYLFVPYQLTLTVTFLTSSDFSLLAL